MNPQVTVANRQVLRDSLGSREIYDLCTCHLFWKQFNIGQMGFSSLCRTYVLAARLPAPEKLDRNVSKAREKDQETPSVFHHLHAKLWSRIHHTLHQQYCRTSRVAGFVRLIPQLPHPHVVCICLWICHNLRHR